MSIQAAEHDGPATADILTFVIADVRGYTRFTVERGDAAAAQLAARFAEIADEIVSSRGGEVLEVRGDEVLSVFSSARRALTAAVDLQRRVAREDDLPVGIGIDAGEAIPVDGGYRGAALNLAARLCAQAGPGEVLASETVINLARKVEGIHYEDRGLLELKGFAEPIHAVLVLPGAAAEKGPARKTLRPESWPRGIVTFIYTDIEGSTKLWQSHPEVMPDVVSRHDTILREAIDGHGGVIFRTVGDGCCAAFGQVRDAVPAALDAQRKLQATSWEEGIELRVRMSLHAGPVDIREGEYIGHTMNRVARLLSAGHGGQVLVSGAVQEMVRDSLPVGTQLLDLGEHMLKDLQLPEHIYQLVAPDLPADFPPVVSLADPSQVTRLPLPTGGYVGSLPAGDLVGRQKELERLLAHVNAVIQGAAALVFLAGEAGIGKTRLTQEVTVSLQDANFLILAGRCYESERTVPYYPFLDVLASAISATPPALLSSVGERWPYLGRLLPDLIANGPTETGTPDENQRLLRAVTGFLEALAQYVPVAVLLDDLYWADGATLQLLLHLARHTGSSRILILGTYRDTDVEGNDPLRRAILDLTREGLVDRVPIQRLDPDCTAALVASALGSDEVPESVADLVFRPTEGNPFFVQQILSSMVERGDVFLEAGRWSHRDIEDIEVPETVRGVIGQRLARLSDDTQAILAEGSVLGQRFTFDELEAVTGRSEEELEDALQSAEAADLVRTVATDTYSYNHALTQHTLYSDLPSRRRRRLHLAVGAALEDLPGAERRAAEIARHFIQGGDGIRAHPWTIRAGDAAEAVFAHSEAEHHYRQALQLAEERGEAAERADILTKLGTVLRVVARYDEALPVLEQAALYYAASTDPEREAQVLIQIGQAHYLRGTADEGVSRLQAFVRQVDGVDTHSVSARALSALYAVLTLLLFAGVRYAEQLAAAERASQLAHEAGDPSALARAEVARGIALLTLGNRDQAELVLDAAVPLAEAEGDLDSLARALDNLGNVYFFHADFQRAESYLQRGLEVAERMGDPAQIAHMTFMIGVGRMWSGGWDLVPYFMERVRKAIESLGDTRVTALSDFGLGQRAVWLGDWDEAERRLTTVVRLTERPLNLPMFKWAQRLLAELELQQGRPQAALTRLQPIINHPGLSNSGTLYVPLAHALLGLGRIEEAQEAIDEAVARARIEKDRVDLALAMRVAAMIAIQRRRWEDALAAIDEGQSIVDRMPFELGQAWFLSFRAEVHRAQGEIDAARAKLEEALQIARDIGARPFIARTEAALSELPAAQDVAG